MVTMVAAVVAAASEPQGSEQKGELCSVLPSVGRRAPRVHGYLLAMCGAIL